MTNRYTRALKQIKSKSIDEKLELLSEVPTNNSGGLYVDVPGVYTTPPITNPIGVTGTPVDLNQDGDGSEGYDGQDTTGLFKEDGTVLTVIPPGDNSYILGPMISMWYAWANYTQIGYVRQSDRKMVNLGRIVGELDDWDGSSGFTSYGQMSVEQAAWYQAQSRQDYRAFYPGPPSNPADEFGRYIGSIVNESRFPNTSTQPKVAHTPGTQTGPDPSDDFASLLKKKELEDKKKRDEMLQMALNAAMLGLDIVAVLGLLFPEPASSAAGAAHLASKLRYVAKLRRLRGALNPFGQRAVRSGAAGRRRVQVYSGRPYQGPRGFGKTTYGTTNRATARTYSNPGPLKGTPGTGSRVNPRGTVDTGTLPQRYIDKYGSRSVLGQRQIKLGPKAARRTFGEMYGYINNYLLEAAPTGSGPAGGTEIADMYVDEVSKTSSPEDLETASNEANNIAREGNQGLSDSELAKIDRDADREARRQTRIDMGRPESMSSDQLSNSITLMYEADAGRFEELSAKYDNLIDQKSLDAAYAEYTERNEYINSWENYYALSPKFERYYKDAERLHNTYVSKIYFGRDANGYVNATVGGESIGGTIYQEKLSEWSDLFTKTWDTFNSDVIPKTYKQRDANREKLSKASDAAFRQHLIAIINEWNASDDELAMDNMGGIVAAAAALGFVFKSISDFFSWYNKQTPEMKQKLQNLLDTQASTQGAFGTYDAAELASIAGQRKRDDDEKIAQLSPRTEKEIDAMLLRGLLRGDYGSGADIERQIRNLRRNQQKGTPGGMQVQRNRGTQVAHYKPQGKLLSENQKRILREIKKPVKVKEIPTKVKVKPTGRKNKSVGVDMMKIPEIPNQFKPPAPSIWSAKDREKNIRASQERKNEVLELVGAAEHHWTYLTEKKRKEDQEKVNEMMSAEFDKHLELMYENHRIKEERMNKVIKAFKKSSDVAPEYPENPPPQPDPETGMHPKYGKHYKHDKLDPHSAEAMPPTGNPEIDANIKKATNAKEKARKLKTLMGKTKRG